MPPLVVGLLQLQGHELTVPAINGEEERRTRAKRARMNRDLISEKIQMQEGHLCN